MKTTFFEWVVTSALKELEKEGFVTSFTKNDVPELKKLRHVKKIKFYANADAVRSYRELKNMKTHIINTAKV